MKTVLLRSAMSFALTCLTAGVLFAQTPPPSPQTPQTPATKADEDRDRMVTATGCLKQEKDVPGAKPNVAERAGVGEDFILTKAKLTKGASGRAAAGAMYKITGLDDEKLRSHSNQQVEVQGRLHDRTAVTGAAKPTTPGPDTAPDEVQEIRATAIKMIASTCSAGTN
jgi:hypothetical protein